MTTYGTDSVEKQMTYLECNELCVPIHTYDTWTMNGERSQWDTRAV